jgi:hypothetical protein
MTRCTLTPWALKKRFALKRKRKQERRFSSGGIFRVGDARVVVDRQVQIFPADRTALALAIAGDAVADLLETTQLFNIDVDDLAGVLHGQSTEEFWKELLS